MTLQGKGLNAFRFYFTDPPQFPAINYWESDLSFNSQIKIAGDQACIKHEHQNKILYLLILFQLLFMNNRYLRQVEKELEQVMNLKRE